MSKASKESATPQPAANRDASQAPTPAVGQVQVQTLACKSCGLCAEYCPQELMKPATEIPAGAREGPLINSAGHVVYEIYDPAGKCNGCGICATVCPEGAVVVYRRKKPKAGVGEGPPGKKEDTHV